MSPGLSRKAMWDALPTPTSYGSTLTAKFRVWIVTGTTLPSTRSRRAPCDKLRTIQYFERGCHESISKDLRRTEGPFRLGHHPHLRMARRTARPNGPHDQGKRKTLPGGDGQRLQDRLAGSHLRDPGVGRRKRGAEEPVKGMDEAG